MAHLDFRASPANRAAQDHPESRAPTARRSVRQDDQEPPADPDRQASQGHRANRDRMGQLASPVRQGHQARQERLGPMGSRARMDDLESRVHQAPATTALRPVLLPDTELFECPVVQFTSNKMDFEN